MKIESVVLRGLFGRDNVLLKLNSPGSINLLIAENGAGKTTLLRVLHAVYRKDWQSFTELPFELLIIDFKDDSSEPYRVYFKNNKTLKHSRESMSVFIHDSEQNSLTIDPNEQGYRFDMENLAGPDLGFWFSSTQRQVARGFDSYDPRYQEPRWLRRSPRWRSRTQMLAQGVDRFDETFPRLAKQSSLFIKADRIIGTSDAAPTSIEFPGDSGRAAQSIEQSRVLETLRNGRELQADWAQELAQTFFERSIRAIERLKGVAPAEDHINELLHRARELSSVKERMKKVCLLPNQPEQQSSLESVVFTPELYALFDVYLGDAEASTGVVVELLGRLEKLQLMVNRKFNGKRLEFDLENGFEILDHSHQDIRIELEDLSSGEQHHLILMLELALSDDTDLLLIDEPETSLNISWKRSFVSDLAEILAGRPSQVIIATHSPSVVSGHESFLVSFESFGVDGNGAG